VTRDKDAEIEGAGYAWLMMGSPACLARLDRDHAGEFRGRGRFVRNGCS
jgi:hypothetical protein